MNQFSIKFSRSFLLKTFTGITIWCLIFSLSAQCPVVDIEVNSNACIDQQLDITNNSSSTLRFEWDFCSGSVLNTPTVVENSVQSSFQEPFDLEHVFDPQLGYFSFIVNRLTNQLFRIDHGQTLDDGYSIVNMDNLGELSGPQGIAIKELNGGWYGLVSSSSGNFWRLTFGTDITSTPTADPLGVFESVTNFGSIEIVELTDRVLALSPGGGSSDPNLLTLDFGNSFLNSPSHNLVEIPGGNLLFGISLLYDCNEWYGILGGFNSGITLVEFGNDLTNLTPAISSISGVSSPRGVHLFRDGAEFYGLAFTQANPANIYRLDFGSTIGDSPIINNLGNFGVLNTTIASEVTQDSSVFRMMTIGFSSRNFSILEFPKQCGASFIYSNEFEPQNISYSTDGLHNINIRGYDEFEQLSSYETFSITISSDIAPAISFSVDESRCVSNPNTFATADSGLSSYSWDFDGDGVEDSNSENPLPFNYSSPGTYNTRLEVSDGICSNFVEQEITIYPDPPVPSFTITTGTTFCSGNELTLINTTDETGFGDVLSYEWIIDGDIANQRDTVYTFSSFGSKTISLQSFIPGCSSAIAEQTISIGEGPTVDFQFTNNCFGSPVQFTSLVTGNNITSYNWNFGDGNSSSDINPLHQYTLEGTYSLSLTVGNSDGCLTVYSNDIVVNDQPLVSFDNGESIENLPVNFSGVDLTLSGDIITSWLWDFDGLGISSDQSPMFTFSAPGDYMVALDVVTSQGCTGRVERLIRVSEAVCSTPSFSVPASLCMEESLSIQNSSVNSVNYRWDFCAGSIANMPFVEQEDTEVELNNAFDIARVYDEPSGYHTFIVNRGNSSLVRLDFGQELSSGYELEDLGDLENLAEPQGISIQEEDGLWYGLVSSLSGNFWKLSFGSSLMSVPTVEDLGTFDGISNFGTIEIVSLTDRVLVLSPGGGSSDSKLLVLDFGTSLANTPSITLQDIAGGNTLYGLSLYFDCTTWYGLLGGYNSGLALLDFGSDLTSAPTVKSIGGVSNPRGVKIVEDAGSYYGMVITHTSSSLYRLDFGNSLDNSPAVNNLGDFGVLNTNIATTLSQDSGVHRIYTVGFTNDKVSVLSFPKDCGASLDYSADFEPEGLTYSTSGTHTISLRANDGLEAYTTSSSSSVTISPDVAPTISFDISSSRCISVENAFTPSVSGLLSYSWDFNNDGIEDRNLESPQVSFDTLGGPGTYIVRLDVDDGTCSNFTEQEITIYPEPPMPVVNASETTQCLNAEISFSNTTDESQHEGVLSYQWDFDGDGLIDSTDPAPSTSFAEPGTKTISVYSQIPGCTSATEIIELTILDGPTANFTATTVCDGDAIDFFNTSENAESFFWVFTDGVTSTSENPSHVFSSAGNYFVELTAADSNGCDDTETIEVVVLDVPEVMFDFGILCTSTAGNLFEDQSSVGNSDIVSWSWSVGDGEQSTSQNPTLFFEESGMKSISLVVNSANGCQSSYSEDVEVLSAPIPDFVSAINCIGEESVFQDITNVENSIIDSWVWDVNGTTYLTQEIGHVFNEAGNYEVTLEVSAQNFCSESITKTIEVLQLPLVDFVVDGNCDNEVINVSDDVISFNDPIISQEWMLDDEVIGNGGEIVIDGLSNGIYELSLSVETENGCLVTSSREIVVDNAPVSSFSFNKYYGVPKEEFTFTNESSAASALLWFLDGALVNESSNSQLFSFEESGDYQVSLVATNDLGCSDTTHQTLNIRIPEVDLLIKNFDLIEENSIGRVLVEIENQSNLPIDVTNVQISLENQFSVSEQVEEFILNGESKLIELNTGIPLEVSQPSFYCVFIESQYAEYTDLTPINNERCITINPAIVVEDPYPNPTIDQFRLRVITPSGGDAVLRVISSSGRLELERSLDTIEGLNTFFVDFSPMNSGIYFVRVDIAGETFLKKVLKL